MCTPFIAFSGLSPRKMVDVAPFDLVFGVVLLLWNIFVVRVLSKVAYEYVLPKRGHYSAVYFARKVIHFLSGGLTALLVPFLFSSPLVPVVLATFFALATYLPHKTGKLMYWFQDPNNMAEVYFCIVWAILIGGLWYVDIWLGVVPVLFMAWGDGITGIVRNYLYSRRVKAAIGNFAMLALCVPIGYLTFGWLGVAAALVASFVERFEFIDDNISVPLSAFAVIAVGTLL